MSTIILPDNRTLAYAEYGDPQGVPVFYFHGTPGSRISNSKDRTPAHLGVRIICTDRPGYGDSTFQQKRRLLDWPKDIGALADTLKIDTFPVIGVSGGGPHALACAYVMPERVKAVGVVSGVGPPGSFESMKDTPFWSWLAFTLGRYLPWPVWYRVFSRIYRDAAADPSKAIDHDRDSRTARDNEVFDRPDIRETCIRSDLEAFKHGLPAFAWDAWLITHPFGFKLEDINVPVHIWHGTEDNAIPMSMANYMEKKIPKSKLTICEGEGHTLVIPRWEEILTTVKQVSIEGL
jgi:pimeloyl-ACP methyl ester carboxylesterase